MKKIISLTFSLLLLILLSACNSDPDVNSNQNQIEYNSQNGNNTYDTNREVTLVFETISSLMITTFPEFACVECGAYCNAYSHDSLCGLCQLPEGAPTNIWNLDTNGIEREIREMICKGTDRHHGGSAAMALPGGLDELLELYNLCLTQDEEAIVKHLKKIACTPDECACPYRTQAALNSIFTDFLDMNEILFPVVSGGKPKQISIYYEGHNNQISISYGMINGMIFTFAVYPMYSTNEEWVKNWLDSLSPIATPDEVVVYLSSEPSEPDGEFSYRGVTRAHFVLSVNAQYIAVYVSNPPCEIPPQEEMKGSWLEYRCDYCNNMSQGPRCYGAPVDVQTALDVILQFKFRILL